MTAAHRRYDWKLKTFEIVGSALVAALMGGGSAYLQAGNMLSAHDVRITENEHKLAEVRSQTVPRAEHEQKWNSVDQRLDQMQKDIRETRQDTKDILKLLGHRAD